MNFLQLFLIFIIIFQVRVISTLLESIKYAGFKSDQMFSFSFDKILYNSTSVGDV
jgi:hypothetical protein